MRYNLKFIYKKGTELYVADTLSHAYTNEKPGTESDWQFDILPFTAISPARMAERQRHTVTDPVMQKVAHFITHGWPEKPKSVPPEVSLKGLRVLVPHVPTQRVCPATAQGTPWS